MIEFTLHPQVHATGHNRGLIGLLERAWVREHKPGDGNLVIVSGFGNYNGGSVSLTCSGITFLRADV